MRRGQRRAERPHKVRWPSHPSNRVGGSSAPFARYHLTSLKNAADRPIVAELVEVSPRPLDRARVATLLLASAPVAARLGWWWWSRSRRRSVPVYAPTDQAPAAVEHTEVEMVRRTMGRWRVRVVNTRWVLPVSPAVSTFSTRPPRTSWLGPVLRLTGAALEAHPRRSAPTVPRLPAPPSRPRL